MSSTLTPSGGVYSSGSFTNTEVTQLFGPEINNGTNFFSGGRTSVNVGALATAEIIAVMQAYRSNLNGRIKKISLEVYQDLLSQQTDNLPRRPSGDGYDNSWETNGQAAALKFAMIAKGTLASTGGTKPITWPPSVGQIGVAWLDPFLVRYSSATSSTYMAYTSYAADSWNITYPTPGNNLVYFLGSATYTKNTPPGTSSTISGQNYYQASGQLNQHELFFLFQNGILEVGSTPDIQQFIIQTSLTQGYSVWTQDSLITQQVNNWRPIYQYTTPGILPVYFDTGTLIAGLNETTSTSHTNPLLGMAFYETALFGTAAGAPQFI